MSQITRMDNAERTRITLGGELRKSRNSVVNLDASGSKMGHWIEQVELDDIRSGYRRIPVWAKYGSLVVIHFSVGLDETNQLYSIRESGRNNIVSPVVYH
jgi:hypothetical protein